MQFETLNQASEQMPSFSKVQDFEIKSLLQNGMKGSYAFLFHTASKAIEKTLDIAHNVTDTVSDSLSFIAPPNESGK